MPFSNIPTPPSQHGKLPQIMVINGPNLNLLGQREPELYGEETLEDLNKMMSHIAERHHVGLTSFQSNHEGAIVDKIHEGIQSVDVAAIIINPAAFSHTSIAIRDALVVFNRPIVEVHISNIYAREDFRMHSHMSAIATGVISGFGIDSYRLAFLWLIKRLESEGVISK
jgi:3-dehydroquinate dehydratase II